MLTANHHQTVNSEYNNSLAQLKNDVNQHESLLMEMGVNLPSNNWVEGGCGDVAALSSGEQVSASAHWWGVDIVMNQKLTQDIIDGLTGGGALAGAITSALGAAGIITGGIATVIGAAIAGIVALKIAEIKIVNNGKGVHWPITWVQWAALLAAVPGGPAAVIAAGLIFIHPVRN